MNGSFARQPERFEPALERLRALGDLDPAEVECLRCAMARSSLVRAHEEIIGEGHPIPVGLVLLEGWAMRVRMLPDGRRQILNFTLPGDLIGHCRQQAPVASSSLVALTKVRICGFPDEMDLPGLERAWRMSSAIDEAYLLRQITRLGRMSAHERIVDLFLELLDRLALAGLVDKGGFAMHATQEVLADALGLTAVHINRTVQQARKAGELSWSGGQLVLHEPAALRTTTGWQPVRVSETWSVGGA